MDFEIEKKIIRVFQLVIKGPLRNPILGNILIALYKENSLISKSKNKHFFIRVFHLVIKGSLRNPILGNVLIAVYREISLISKSEKKKKRTIFFFY